jgi:hypothetical protein
MTTTVETGGLGNQIIRNLAISFIAEKNDLFVNYSSHSKIESLGIELYVGSKVHSSFINLNDENYMSIFNSYDIKSNLKGEYAFFQTKEIIDLIYEYLRRDDNLMRIQNANPYKLRYMNNDDCYVHIRLGDVTYLNPGLEYYLKALSMIQFDKLYISSDSPEHQIVKGIIGIYPGTEIIDKDEVETIQFASTCKNIVLSHGSFSALIGYLSFYSDVYYPKYEEEKIKWHGDLFSIPNWSVVDKDI